jgi:endoglucanase
MSKWLRLGAAQGLETVDGKSAVCVNLATNIKGPDRRGNVGRDISKPANLIYQPGIEALKPNTRYSLTFLAKRDGAGAVSAKERLMASVTATERDITNGKDPFGNTVPNDYWPGVYAENQLSIGNTFASYKIDFVTPVQPRTDGGTGEVMFQALSDTNSGRICLSGVRLTTAGAFADGRNEESTRTTYSSSVSIRYNTVTAGLPNEAQRFVITGIAKYPLAPTRVVIKRNGSVVSEFPIPSSDIKTDPLTNLNYYVYETKQATGGYTVAVQPNGAVGAETAPVTLGTYSVAAPNLKRDALNFYYAQRSTGAINGGPFGTYRNWFDRGPQKYAASSVACFNGVDNFGNDFAASCNDSTIPVNFRKNVSGGWFDAGDYGKYTVNAAYTLWVMQNAAELMQRNGSLENKFPAGLLGYAQSGSLSDLLKEIKYEMEWLLKMQIFNERVYLGSITVPVGKLDNSANVVAENRADLFVTEAGVDSPAETTTGKLSNGLAYQANRYRVKIDTDNVHKRQRILEPEGLVFSALHWDSWADKGIPLKPENSTAPQYLMYPTTAATLDFAAVTAQCSRVFKSVDPDLSDRCLNQSKLAYAAAVKWPNIYRYGEWSDGKTYHLPSINEGGGAYADSKIDDEWTWASGELYLSTKLPEYLERFKGRTASECALMAIERYATGIMWNRVRNLPFLSMLTLGLDIDVNNPSVCPDKQPLPSKRLVEIADEIAGYTKGSVDGLTTKYEEAAWRVPIPVAGTGSGGSLKGEVFNWASNADIASAAILLKHADMVAPKAEYKEAIRGIMDYLFGLNPLGKSYVTGYGQNPPRNPHHRFFAKHANINMPPALPGMLVGGPNGQWRGSVLGINQVRKGYGAAAKYYMDNVMAKCNPLDKTRATDGIVTDATRGGVACYMDHVDLYMTNEVAINWNAPLLWLSAFVD